uniref:NAD-dependent epimerase/dehydratase domain-containing protein n=1 Tax=Corethron hystrix TaxID=216773 RepID=A0A7S1BVR6_9STRA
MSSPSESAAVIITGGGGFLGQCLACSLLSSERLLVDCDGAPRSVGHVYLADVAFPPSLRPELAARPDAVSQLVGDVADPAFCRSLYRSAVGTGAGRPVSVFHLGAVMSGDGERDFDRCIATNLRGTLNMLEGARELSPSCRAKFVFASAGAIIGSGHPADYVSETDAVSDRCRATPHTTYGATKACSELLLADYSRRGFLDGRGVRLPTVVVRAGKPNAATTSCFSAVVREPLAGVDVVLPVDPHVVHAVTGVRAAVGAMLAVHDADADLVDRTLGFDRTVFLPARALSLGDLRDALLEAVDPEAHGKLGTIAFDVDQDLNAIVSSFPTVVDAYRAKALGVPDAPAAADLIREYAEDFPAALAPGVRLRSPTAATEERPPSPKKVAVVTGAGSGIGRAVALRLAAGGYAVVLVGRRRAKLEETAAALPPGARSLCVPADVCSEPDVRRIFAETEATFGRVDLLFNNAGVGAPTRNVSEVPAEEFRRVMETNVTGAFLVGKWAMRAMARNAPVPGGRIINNGSLSAHVPRPQTAPYTVSKHAVLGLTKCMALDGRELNVACGQIDFGNVGTELSRAINTPGAGAMQADGTKKVEPSMGPEDAAETVWAMANLPLEANVLNMTVMATKMPFVGRG